MHNYRRIESRTVLGKRGRKDDKEWLEFYPDALYFGFDCFGFRTAFPDRKSATNWLGVCLEQLAKKTDYAGRSKSIKPPMSAPERQAKRRALCRRMKSGLEAIRVAKTIKDAREIASNALKIDRPINST